MRAFSLLVGILLTILSGLLVVSPVAAQDDDRDPVLDYLINLGASPPAADPAISVLEHVTVAHFLAESGIDRADYGLAHAIAQRLKREDIELAELSAIQTADLETRLTYRILSIVAVSNLLMFTVWRWFAVSADGKS